MMGKKAKTIVLRRKDLLKRAQVQDLHRQSVNFSNCGNATSHGLFTKMEQCFTRGVLKKIICPITHQRSSQVAVLIFAQNLLGAMQDLLVIKERKILFVLQPIHKKQLFLAP